MLVLAKILSLSKITKLLRLRGLFSCTWTNGRDVAEWLERLTANAVVGTVLGSIPASSDTVHAMLGAADEAVLNIVNKKKNPQKIPL